MKAVRNADVISHPENGVTLVHMPKRATYVSIKDIQDTIYCNAENHNKEDRTSGMLKWFNGKHCSLMLVCLFFKKSVKLAVLLKKAFIRIIILHYPPNPSWGGRVKGQKARVSSFAKEGSQRIKTVFYLWATRGFLGFPGGLAVKNPPANAGDMGSIPGSGRSPGEEMATHSSILAWRMPWTEEPGGLQSMGLRRVGHNKGTEQQQEAFLALDGTSKEPNFEDA